MKSLGKEVVFKKNPLILNRLFFYIVPFIFSTGFFAQQRKDAVESTWEKQQRDYKYVRSKNYKGPTNWYSDEPANINKDTYSDETDNAQFQEGLKYNPKQIERDRAKRFDEKSKGPLSLEPTIKKPDPIEFPDIDPPEIDLPDVDLPDVDVPQVPLSFWKTLLFILLFAALMLVVYYYLKNKGQANRTVNLDVENDWDPEIIPKTELELRLEKALQEENYREAIRVYFTMVLKELINKAWIHWKKEKTNYQYELELMGKPNQSDFKELVRIYNIVWYGEFALNPDSFRASQDLFLSYLKNISQK